MRIQTRKRGNRTMKRDIFAEHINEQLKLLNQIEVLNWFLLSVILTMWLLGFLGVLR